LGSKPLFCGVTEAPGWGGVYAGVLSIALGAAGVGSWLFSLASSSSSVGFVSGLEIGAIIFLPATSTVLPLMLVTGGVGSLVAGAVMSGAIGALALETPVIVGPALGVGVGAGTGAGVCDSAKDWSALARSCSTALDTTLSSIAAVLAGDAGCSGNGAGTAAGA